MATQTFTLSVELVDAKAIDVEVVPHYGEEKSGIRLFTFIPKLVYLLIKTLYLRVFKSS